MTSSFVKILANHKGPYKLRTVRTKDEKGRPRGAWVKERTDDPVEAAFALIKGDVTGVTVWSESEEQFVLTIEAADKAVWEAERDGWKDKVKAVVTEVRKALPKAEISAPTGVNDVTKARVLRLRLEGMTYMEIETEVLGETRKGFWAWRIVKAAEKAAEKAKGGG